MRGVSFLGLLLALGCSRDGAGRAQPLQERALADSAKPIVTAIYQFHHERGLWPRDLDELDSDYLKRERSRGWVYEPWYNDRWTLSNFSADFDSAVRLIHTADKKSEWKLDYGDSEMSLDVRQNLPKFQPVDGEEKKKRRRETLLQRIAQHPKEILHHKGLISDLYKDGRYQESRKACLKCLERWPDLWWPQLMLSLIDLKLGEFARGDERLMAWVGKHNDFSHFYLAAYFYYKAGQKERLLATLRKAAELPLKGISVEWEDTYEHFGSLSAVEIVSRATELAYHEGQMQVCLALCNRWHQYVDDENYGDREFHLFRAACLLKQGKLADAGKEAEKASKANCRACLLGDYVERFKKAIEAGDQDFRYVSPSEYGKEASGADYWDIVIDYK